MAKDLIAYKDWLKRTSLVARARSTQLKELDRALERYEQFGGGDARWRLEQALEAWKKSKGPGDAWKRSDRNKKEHAFEELTALLKGGDSDKHKGEVPDFMQPELAHARLGVLYLFSHTEVDSNMFSVVLEGALSSTGGVLGYLGASPSSGGMGSSGASLAKSTVTTASIPGKQLFAAAEGAAYQAKTQQERSLYDKALTWFEAFASKVWAMIEAKFGDVSVTFSAVKNLIKLCASTFCSAAAPFVSAGMDMAKGVVNMLDAAIDRIRTWQMGKGVELLAGHPSTIVDSLKRAMNMSLFEGLYQLLKGAGDAAMTALTAGATMIVKVVVALTEMIVKVVWRMIEISRMDRFFAEAAEHWKARGQSNGLHTQPFAFARWYKKFVLPLPGLAALTLNSGVCGDKMHFLSMFTDGSTTIKQSEFDRGVAFVDSLKRYGSDYLGKCAYAFHSGDPMVASLLAFAKTHNAIQSKKQKAWSIFMKFANA